MQLARRIERLPPYLFVEISRKIAEKRAQGVDVISFGIGDPDIPTPPHVIDALVEAARDPASHRYPETEGLPEFRRAVAEWYERRFGLSFDPQREVLSLIGSKDGIGHVALCFIDPGDLALVPDPAYPVYAVGTLFAGGEPYYLPLREENGFLPDLDAVPADVARRAKLIWLNYPNNPTGAVASLGFYNEVVRFARHYDIAVVSDLAYSEVTYDGYVAPSMLQADGAKDVCIEMNSLSKAFNMTGWRIGFAVGNPDLIAALNKLKSNIDSRQFAAIDIAAAFALDNLRNDETVALYGKRRDILVDGLNSLGWQVRKPLASLYVWASVPEGCTSADFAKRLLRDAGVLVIPGSAYGEYGEGYVRMSLTVSGDKDGERVAEAVKRIKDSIRVSWG